ncbi:hypothetical protein [Sphingomonas adhaesiva]|jgi:hypothetical protein|uniref:hypothetical protein n=1 Tax=Sphingomonas adhaesiva TaxID=28212 RepID=UPI0035C67715
MRKGELPEFDARRGQFKHTVEISNLWRMLLGEIGLRTSFDEREAVRDGNAA